MPAPELDPRDLTLLQRAVDLSRRALEDEGKTPFGALVVIGDDVVGEGTSDVVKLHDPTAHAEVQALRAAGQRLGRHLMQDAVMYCSSEPCPMCLIACYWARIPRIVFGASSQDVAEHGFEDLQFYRQLTLPADRRDLREDRPEGPLRDQAVAALKAWTLTLPEPVVPKR